jgi:hypothetical protein
MQKNISDYKAKSFITEKNLSSIAYEVKRTRAVWDDALSIPGTNRRGGWRCPPGTRYGGQITDRFGRNCGWGVSRRLANQITDIGERLEDIGERRQARREQRAVRRQGRPGAVERAAGRVARALESTDTTPEVARPRRERRGPAQRRPNLRDSEQRRMEREIAEPGAPRTDQRRRRATAEVVERPRPAAPVAEPAKKVPAKKAAAKKAPAKKAPAKKKAAAKKAVAKKRVAKKSPAKKTPIRKQPYDAAFVRNEWIKNGDNWLKGRWRVRVDEDGNLVAEDPVRGDIFVQGRGSRVSASDHLNAFEEFLGDADEALYVKPSSPDKPPKATPAKKKPAKKAARSKVPAKLRLDSDNAANSERMRQARADRARGAGKKVDLGQALNDDRANGYILNVIDNGRLEIVNDRNNFGQTEAERLRATTRANSRIKQATRRLEGIERAINRGELADNDYVEFTGERFNIANVKTRLRDHIDGWQEVLKANATPPQVDSDNAPRSEVRVERALRRPQRININDLVPIPTIANNIDDGAADRIKNLPIAPDAGPENARLARQFKRELNQLKRALDGRSDNAILVLADGNERQVGQFRNNLNAAIEAWGDFENRAMNARPQRVDSDNAAMSEEVRRANEIAQNAQNANFFTENEMIRFMSAARSTPDNIFRQLARFEQRLTRQVRDIESADVEIDDIDRALDLYDRQKQGHIDDRNRRMDNVNELRQRLAQNQADPAAAREYWFAVSQFVEANHEVRSNITLRNAWEKRREQLVGQLKPESASEILRNEKAVKEARNRVAAALKKQQVFLAEYLDKRYGKNSNNKPWLEMTPEKLKDLKERAVRGDDAAKQELVTWAKAMYEHPLIEGTNGNNYQIVMDQRAEVVRNGDIYLKGTVYYVDENGRRTRVGSTEREVHISAADPKDWYVKNAYLKIESERHKKAGIATTYNQHAYMWANAAGIPKALVGTAWDGPYVWARAGFRTNLYTGQVSKMEGQLSAFRRGDMSGLIKSEAEAVRVAALIRDFKSWQKMPRAQRPEQAPVGHIDFIYALDIPDGQGKEARQKQLKDWFVEYMGLGSGAFDFAQNGITKDPRD